MAEKMASPSAPPIHCDALNSAAAALDAGFRQALIAAAIFLLAAALIALRTTGARGEPQTAELTAVRQAAAGDATVRLTER